MDWRRGERFFMRWLIDGDEANNNGNWQWIASVGVDPQPFFRRIYNPALPHGAVRPRRHATSAATCRSSRRCRTSYLREPWTMPEDVQREAGCVIGRDYPAPVVDRKQARAERDRALPRRGLGGGGGPRPRGRGGRRGGLGGDQQVVEDRRRQRALEQRASSSACSAQVAAVRVLVPEPRDLGAARRSTRACGSPSRTSPPRAPRRSRARRRSRRRARSSSSCAGVNAWTSTTCSRPCWASSPCRRKSSIRADRAQQPPPRRARPRARRASGSAASRSPWCDGSPQNAITPAGAQHAPELAERRVEVGQVVQHRVAEDEVERVVRERELAPPRCSTVSTASAEPLGATPRARRACPARCRSPRPRRSRRRAAG